MIVFELIPFTLSPAAVDKHQLHVEKPAKVRGRPKPCPIWAKLGDAYNERGESVASYG